MTLDQINKRSPHRMGRVFESVYLNSKDKTVEPELFDYWGSILGRWYILVKKRRAAIR